MSNENNYTNESEHELFVGVRIELAEMRKDFHSVKESLDKLEASLSHQYVTKQEFVPVRNIVYGMVSIVTVSVFAALIKLVVM